MVTNQQANEWYPANEIHQTQAKPKILLTVFMDYLVVVHHGLIPEGGTVTIIRCLREAIHQKK